MVSSVGLTIGTGGVGANMTFRIFFGGWLYPEEASFGAAGAVELEEFPVDCARSAAEAAQVTNAPHMRRVNTFRAGMAPSGLDVVDGVSAGMSVFSF